MQEPRNLRGCLIIGIFAPLLQTMTKYSHFFRLSIWIKVQQCCCYCIRTLQFPSQCYQAFCAFVKTCSCSHFTVMTFFSCSGITATGTTATYITLPLKSMPSISLNPPLWRHWVVFTPLTPLTTLLYKYHIPLWTSTGKILAFLGLSWGFLGTQRFPWQWHQNLFFSNLGKDAALHWERRRHSTQTDKRSLN